MIEPCKLTYKRTWRFSSQYQTGPIAPQQAEWITEVCSQHPNTFISSVEVENIGWLSVTETTITLTLTEIP